MIYFHEAESFAKIDCHKYLILLCKLKRKERGWTGGCREGERGRGERGREMGERRREEEREKDTPCTPPPQEIVLQNVT